MLFIGTSDQQILSLVLSAVVEDEPGILDVLTPDQWEQVADFRLRLQGA